MKDYETATLVNKLTHIAVGLHNHDSLREHISRCIKAALKKDSILMGNPSQNDIDVVHRPKHYKVFVEVEAIDLIAGSMTERAFHGYCMGNVLKYRLRAGKKVNALEDLAKADKYEALYIAKKHLCREYSL